MAEQPRVPAGSPKGGQFTFSHSSSTGQMRKRVPKTGYHTTDAANLESIAKKGLLPFGPRPGDDPAVSFADNLYPVGHEYAPENNPGPPGPHASVTLKVRIPPRGKIFDDAEVRDFQSQADGPDSHLGPASAFLLAKRGVQPKDIFVVEPGTRKTIPLKKFIKEGRLKKIMDGGKKFDAIRETEKTEKTELERQIEQHEREVAARIAAQPKGRAAAARRGWIARREKANG